MHVNLQCIEFVHQHRIVLVCMQAYSQQTMTAQLEVNSCRQSRALTAAFQVCLHALLCFGSCMESMAEPGQSLLSCSFAVF